jgi:uncharacterized membrane protein
MKKLFGILLAAPLICGLGCNNSPPGGPGASKPSTGKTVGEKAHETTGVGNSENTFKISLPSLETSIKQGEKKTVKISISRGKNFDQDVNLTLSGLPKGITASPASPTIKASDKEADVTFEAAKDAELGDFTVKVDAAPKDGAATSADMKLGVKKP